MDTHHIEDITYEFVEGSEVIPYMAPHEVRAATPSLNAA